MTQDDLVDMIELDIPDAPRATILDQAKRMARELCQEANAWVLTGIAVVGAKSGYPQLLAPEDADVLRIIALTDGDKPLCPRKHFDQFSAGRVTLHVKPQNDSLSGTIACRPKVGADIPADLLLNYADTIADGARWRLLMMPQPWQQPDLASFHRDLYLSGVSDAKRKAAFGHAQGGARVRPRRFI